jgi:hypothetical protein
MGEVVRGVFGGSPFPRLADLETAVWEAVMAFEGEVPTMAVIGVLRLIEHRLLSEVHQ